MKIGVPNKTIFAFFLLSWIVAAFGCESHQDYVAARTAALRKMYPQGTAREEVQAKWGAINPDFSTSRPVAGWDAHQNRFIAEKLKDLEASSGKRIEFVDRYWGSDSSMSLCYCWYFYDSGNKIVDVEWQYKSD